MSKDTVRIDLHLHTNASDGKDTPESLVKRAKGLALEAIAVTDHDTVDAVLETMRLCDAVNIMCIPGVELSIEHSSELHLLGYFINLENKALEMALEGLRHRRALRIGQMVQKLNDLGLSVTLEEVQAQSAGRSIGRGHLARAMVSRGLVKDTDEVFDKFLALGKPAYVSHRRMGLKEAIDAIHAAGGSAVWAHPCLTTTDELSQRNLAVAMKKMGLDGMECYHPAMDRATSLRFVRWCRELCLCVTGGSDWHADPQRAEMACILKDWNPLNDYPMLKEDIRLRRRFF